MGLTVFAQRLKHLREERGLKQNELAKAVGVTPNTISSYEKSDTEGNGKKPTLENAQLIAEYFNVSLDWLCGLDRYIMNANELTDIHLRSMANVMFLTPCEVHGNEISFTNDKLADFVRELSEAIYFYHAGKISEKLMKMYIDEIINDYTCKI